MSQRILQDMGRGVTILYGKGAYTGEARSILYTVITRSEISVLKRIVREEDPAAFFVVGQAYEVLGEGFKAIDEGQ